MMEASPFPAPTLQTEAAQMLPKAAGCGPEPSAGLGTDCRDRRGHQVTKDSHTKYFRQTFRVSLPRTVPPAELYHPANAQKQFLKRLNFIIPSLGLHRGHIPLRMPLLSRCKAVEAV